MAYTTKMLFVHNYFYAGANSTIILSLTDINLIQTKIIILLLLFVIRKCMAN